MDVREVGNHGSPELGCVCRGGEDGPLSMGKDGKPAPASEASQERVKLARVLYVKCHQGGGKYRLAIEPCLILVQMTLSELPQPRLLH